MRNCFLILLLTFAKYSTAQNEVIYNNLAAELQRNINYKLKKGWYNPSLEYFTTDLVSILSVNPAFYRSLQKMDTIAIANSKEELRTKTLVLFFQQLNIDTFIIGNDKKIHFGKLNAYLCNCLQNTKYPDLSDTLQKSVFERCIDRFYKDTNNNKELKQIINTEWSFNRSLYNNYDSRYYNWRLLKECASFQEAIMKKILSEAIKSEKFWKTLY